MSVVVTGLGALTAAGLDRADLLGPDRATCVRPRSLAPYPGFPSLGDVHAASMPEPPVKALFPGRGTRALGEEGRAALCAAVIACREAGLEPPCGGGVGVALGTARAGLDEYAWLFTEGVSRGPDGVMPARGPRTGCNTPASELSILLRAAGPNVTISTGMASAGDAVGAAADLVRDGRAAAMLAGGVDLISYMVVYAERTADPGFATVRDPMPFDRRRAGGAPGEAAVVVVLEDAGRASRRGAAALAELAGTGAGFDPRASRDGSAAAARRALGEALASAGIRAGEVDAVIASASGSPGRDAAEAGAIAAVLGGRPPVCSVAGAVGDCAGAAAAVQVAVAVAALDAQVVPGTCGLRLADPGLGIRVTREPLRVPLRLVLTLTVDPAGHASAILLRGAR